MNWKIKPARILKGEISPPPDKSISHRAVMFGSISRSAIRVNNFLKAGDCLATVEAFRKMGVEIKEEGPSLVIHGKGLRGLTKPKGDLYLGNSGTSMRIIAGILAGQGFDVTLTGDESLSSRPMNRIIEPLSRMGCKIDSLKGGLAPLVVHGTDKPLKAVNYVSPVASAQVKSAVLAAALYADGVTTFTEPFQSRDHTERMLENFGASITCSGLVTEIEGSKELEGRDVNVPGDISSAAFFIVGALLGENSRVILKNVGLNSTRRGIIEILRRMGASIEVLHVHSGQEPAGDIEVKSSSLNGASVKNSEIPLLIDEIPILLVAACFAEGETKIDGVAELRVKETDRVRSMIANLSKMGARITDRGSSLVVAGGLKRFKAGAFESYKDHRTAMSAAIASLFADDDSVIADVDCVNTSYPNFLHDLEQLRK